MRKLDGATMQGQTFRGKRALAASLVDSQPPATAFFCRTRPRQNLRGVPAFRLAIPITNSKLMSDAPNRVVY
jgi:hypothetical protein